MTSASNYQKDGSMTYHNQDGSPKYFPNSFNGPVESAAGKLSTFYANGEVDRFENSANDSDYVQVRIFWRDVLPADEKARLVKSIAGDLKNASVFIIERAVKNFMNVDDELGRKLIDELRKSGVPINASGKSANL